MAFPNPSPACLHWLGDNLASRGRNPDMVNVWTRDDLPDHDAIRDVDDMHGNGMRSRVIGLALDTVVGHLNANHPKPAPGMLWATKADADRWRRAHAIVEQERGQARSERDTAANEWRRQVERARVASDRALRAERERATATVRAEAAERERDEALEASALFQRDVHAWRTRAEAAEARTTLAITREDVEAALAQEHRMAFGTPVVAIEVALETVCSLFGVKAEPADPVEEKAEELMRVLAPETEDRTWGILTEPAREDFRRLAAHVLGKEAKR